MDFRNAKELLKVCQEQGLSISAVMLQRELTEGEQHPRASPPRARANTASVLSVSFASRFTSWDNPMCAPAPI